MWFLRYPDVLTTDRQTDGRTDWQTDMLIKIFRTFAVR